jgi:hypothetical protein
MTCDNCGSQDHDKSYCQIVDDGTEDGGLPMLITKEQASGSMPMPNVTHVKNKCPASSQQIMEQNKRTSLNVERLDIEETPSKVACLTCLNCKEDSHNLKNCPHLMFHCDHLTEHMSYYECKNNINVDVPKTPSKPRACSNCKGDDHNTNCKKVDHTKRTCPYKEFECAHDPEHTTYFDCENNVDGPKTPSKLRACTNCKNVNHTIKNCPHKEFECAHDPGHTTYFDCENNIQKGA